MSCVRGYVVSEDMLCQRIRVERERERKGNTHLFCRAIRYNPRSVYRQASQRKMPSYFYYSSCRSFLPLRRSSSPPRHRPHQWIRRWILCWMPKRVIFLTLPDPSSTPLPLVFPPRFSDPRNCPTSFENDSSLEIPILPSVHHEHPNISDDRTPMF